MSAVPSPSSTPTTVEAIAAAAELEAAKILHQAAYRRVEHLRSQLLETLREPVVSSSRANKIMELTDDFYSAVVRVEVLGEKIHDLTAKREFPLPAVEE